MEQPKENRDFYASTTQREVFLELLTHPTIEGSFFLTGGIALAVFYLFEIYPDLDLDTVYQNAKLKDAIFDDPPTAGYQLEEGISFLKENPPLMPGIKREFDLDEFTQFFDKVLEWLYGRYKA
jgi:hypothetical protein